MRSLVTIASRTKVLWGSSRGDGTRDQAQNGGGAFSIGHVLSSWRFHGMIPWVPKVFPRVPLESSVWAEPEKAPEKSLAPSVHKILQE